MRSTKGFIRAGVLAATWLLAAGSSLPAGIQSIMISADGDSPAISGAVWYPCAAEPTEIHAGPFRVFGAKDCPIMGTRLPLVVISHGRTGSHLMHHDTAQTLADAGFVVAAISHPGDTAQDDSESNTLSAFVRRPEDMRRLVDYLLGSWRSAASIDPNRIGFFGFSRGGYAALVTIGAVPAFGRNLGMCAGRTDRICEAVHKGALSLPPPDARIKAAVVADPLGVFFDDKSFQHVRVPVQIWRSEFGGDSVTPGNVAAIAAALPAKPELHTVVGAGHFAFVPPCPAAMRQVASDICSDLPGFERAAFHKSWNAQVVDFFRRNLP